MSSTIPEVVSNEKHTTISHSLEALMERPRVNSNYVDSWTKQLTLKMLLFMNKKNLT